MSGKKGGNLLSVKGDRGLSIANPLFRNFFLIAALLILIFFISSNSNETRNIAYSSNIFENKTIFSHLDKADKIPYVIKSRKYFDRGDIHFVYFQIELLGDVGRENLSAVAQKVVKRVISQEYCHYIKIDFGQYGYVDFAPFGDWEKAGKVPINGYEEFKFKYFLSSFLDLK